MPKTSTGTYDQASLLRLAGEFQAVVDSLKLLAKSLELNAQAEISIRFVAEMERALKYMPRFADDGHDQLRQVLIARKHFRSASNGTHTEAPKKKKRGGGP